MSELQEIKPLSTMPPPIPDDAAEHFDLDVAMRSALNSMGPPPAPTIDLEPTPSAEKTDRKIPRWAQAAVALVAGAVIALTAQSFGARESAPDEVVVETEQATAESPDPSVAPEPAATEETTREIADGEPGLEISQADVDAVIEADRAAAAAATPHLPDQYHTPQARFEREQERRERRAAAEAAEAAAAAAAAEEAARAALPGHPDREAVRDAMERVRGAVAQCTNGRHGTAQVNITVHHSGRVQGARVEGHFAGTPEGSCMARAVRGARFPRFSEDRFSLVYPFTF